MKTLNNTQDKVNREFNYEQIAAVENGGFVIPFERKVDFDDCRTEVSIYDLNPKQVKAIYNAPFLNVSLHTSAFDYLFPRELEGNANKYIYIVKRGNQTFLVNNEGFGYSRYIVELKNY
jgi:hypothetical protein